MTNTAGIWLVDPHKENLARGVDEADPEWVPYLRRLNDVPGLCTVDCCYGHDHGPDASKHPYVTFRATEGLLGPLLTAVGEVLGPVQLADPDVLTHVDVYGRVTTTEDHGIGPGYYYTVVVAWDQALVFDDVAGSVVSRIEAIQGP